MRPPCTVRLELFEGPLDLLLHLIKKSEVEITDIPIATITDQYLAMIEDVSTLDLDHAGEYLVMAATLMVIKSRMLLAEEAEDEEGAEEDPRAALVEQLLEYQRYREAAGHLGSRPLLAREVFAAPGEPVPPGGEDAPPVRDATLGDLLEALRAVLARQAQARPHEIMRPLRSVADCVHLILSRFALDDAIAFKDLFEPDATRGDVIVTFLALLELVRLKVVRARQDERFGEIVIALAVGSLEEAVERSRDIQTFEHSPMAEVEDGHADG